MYALKMGIAVLDEFPSEEEAQAELDKHVNARPALKPLLRVEPITLPPSREHPDFKPGTFLPRKRS